MLYLPLIFLYSSEHWQTTIGILILAGLGTAIAAYMINRLEGYTRAWSRNRTALYKIKLNDAEKRSGSLSETQAQRRLLLIVDNEVDDRHRDIISDFHFFGERLTSLLSKKK